MNSVILEIINNKDLKSTIFCVADTNAISTYEYINNVLKEKKVIFLDIDLNFIISFLLRIFTKNILFNL